VPTFSSVPREEAQRAVLPPRQPRQQQYREHVRNLGTNPVGRLELDETARLMTERARLKSAAAEEGITLEFRRQGNTIYFWKKGDPPPRIDGPQESFRRSPRSPRERARQYREAHLKDIAARERSESVRTVQGGGTETNRRRH
jgi:hypothetical protein